MQKNAQTLTVSLVQFKATNEIQENKEKISRYFKEAVAQGAECVIFPEASMCSFGSPLEVLRPLAQHESPAFIQFMQTLAKQYQCYTVVGVLNLPEQAQDQRVVNQLLAIDPQGQVIQRYTKLHLYDAFAFKESDKVSPGLIKGDGSELGLFKIKAFTFGLINCYDLRFPELARALTVRGADVLSISAAWINGPYKEQHWDILTRARAIENTAYVLACGQTGTRNAAQSRIIDPMGTIVAGGSEEEGVITATLTQARLQAVRQTLPCLQNRRLV